MGVPSDVAALVVGEGIETVFAPIIALPEIRATAALSAGDLGTFEPSLDLASLVIARDNDGDGALVAKPLAMRYPRLGIPITVILEQYGGVGIGARAHDAEDAGELGHAQDVGRVRRLSCVEDDSENLAFGEVEDRQPVETGAASPGVVLVQSPGTLPRAGRAFFSAHAHGADDPAAEAQVGRRSCLATGEFEAKSINLKPSWCTRARRRSATLPRGGRASARLGGEQRWIPEGPESVLPIQLIGLPFGGNRRQCTGCEGHGVGAGSFHATAPDRKRQPGWRESDPIRPFGSVQGPHGTLSRCRQLPSQHGMRLTDAADEATFYTATTVIADTGEKGVDLLRRRRRK